MEEGFVPNCKVTQSASLEALQKENELLKHENEALKERLKKVMAFAQDFLGSCSDLVVSPRQGPNEPYQFPLEPPSYSQASPLIVTPVFEYDFPCLAYKIAKMRE